ncbi:FkbM family methyltransferase [Roseobacter sp. HKCCA0882]|uniref:FkbM family methyltransferase n=1 Tax=Roseobacter sp. HKCCA0882 TaxID=3120337 RepID=UPI0030ED9187
MKAYTDINLGRSLVNKLTELLINARLIFRGRPVRVAMENASMYTVSDGEMQINICRPGRYNRYKRGVKRGIDALAADYHLDTLKGIDGGTLIDCGANVGELGIWAKARNMKYIAFEPEHLEADCCDRNNYGSQSLTIRKALWKETTTLEFFHKADTADSSAFSVRDYTSKSLVPAARLDDEVDPSKLSHPIILKLEAEGAEPEVLEGATKFVTFADYVAVDCGYERGADQDHTFVEVNNFLSHIGFRIVAANFKVRLTVLFHRSGHKINTTSEQIEV